MNKMNDGELADLIEENLKDDLDELWKKLTPFDRRRVFPRLISEYIRYNY